MDFEEKATFAGSDQRGSEVFEFSQWLEGIENSNRRETDHAFNREVTLWQRGTELRSRAFMPGMTIEYPYPITTIADRILKMAVKYQQAQIVLSVGTSRVALDACTRGYYSQSLALCRGLFESWRRCAYARRSPGDAYRWYPASAVSSDIKAHLAEKFTSENPKYQDWDIAFPVDHNGDLVTQEDRFFLE